MGGGLTLRLAAEPIAQTAPEITSEIDGSPPDGYAFCREAAQTRVDIARLGERGGQRVRVGYGLVDAGADMRPRHERRVPDQRNASAGHALGFEVVDRLQE